MKKYILTILNLLFLPLLIQAQCLPDLIREYEEYCNELVADTFMQEGVITNKYIHIGDGFYNCKRDTTWEDIDCPKYKYSELLSIMNFHPLHIERSDNFVWPIGHVLLEEEIHDIRKVKTSREYICIVKRREVVPFSEHFWEWIKNNR